MKSAAEIVKEVGIGDRTRRELAQNSREKATNAVKTALAALDKPRADKELEIRTSQTQLDSQTRELEAAISKAKKTSASLEKYIDRLVSSEPKQRTLQSEVEELDREVRVVETVQKVVAK